MSVFLVVIGTDQYFIPESQWTPDMEELFETPAPPPADYEEDLYQAQCYRDWQNKVKAFQREQVTYHANMYTFPCTLHILARHLIFTE